MASRARVSSGLEAAASAPESQENNDAQSLHRCLRDIVALSTLPAIWSGASPTRIAESLAGSLFAMLVPEFVFTSLTGTPQTPPVTVAQTGRSETSTTVAEQVGPAIMEWARTRDPEELLPLNWPSGDGKVVWVLTRAIGFNAELGVIGVAFAESHSISPMHHVILNVAATQAGTATQRAHLLDSLRNSEERFRSLVSVITNVPWVADPEGRFVTPQPAWETYTAQNWQEHQGFGWVEALHPDDRARVQETWNAACASRTLYQSEGRIWHAPSREWRHFMARATPLFNADRSVREWVGTYTDVENEKRSQRALRQSEAHFRGMFDGLPAAIYTTDAEGRLTYFNPAAVEFSGRQPELGTDQWCVTWKLFHPNGAPMPHSECPMAVALKEGRIVRGAEAIAERPDGRRIWFTPFPTPLRDSEGKITGGINMLVDITERKRAEQQIRESEERFRSVFNSSAIGVAVLSLEAGFLQVNAAYCAITGYSEEEMTKLDWAKLTHPDDRAELQAKIEHLMGGSIPSFVIEERYFTKDRRTVWVQNSVSLTHNGEGRPESIIALCEDITARKRGEKAVGQLAGIIESSNDAIISKDLNGVIQTWNYGAERLFGYTSAEAVGKPVTMLIPPAQMHEEDLIIQRIRNGSRMDHYDTVRCRKDGTLVDVSVAVSPIIESGKVVGASNVTRDISDRKRADEERAKLLRTAELLNRIGPLISSDLDAERLTQTITDLATEVTGAQFGAFFHNVVNDNGEEYLLYTLSGVPRETFAHFPMPRNTAIFGPTFRGEGIVRSADITQDPRYGKNAPYRGMPAGHLPVRSYLAAPVTSRDGKVLGGLFFGHGRVAVFTEQHEVVVRAIAGQAAIALDNAFLFTETRRKKEELARANHDLQRANADLEQFAYSASHDLQEPIRNVALYGEILGRRYGQVLDDKGKEYLAFVRTGAIRMEALVKDLLAYTQAAGRDQTIENVDSEHALARSLENLATIIRDTQAAITHDPLPVLRIDQVQLQQLFQNLVGNAIKYSRDREAPRVHIGANLMDGRWRFAVQDNGIGIHPDHKEKIFGIFKRLHTDGKYSGTGIGLAICQKIVERNNGRLWVESAGEGKGSTFYFTLPAGVGDE